MEGYFCWGWDQHPFTSHVAWFNGPNESLKVQKVSQYFFSSVFPRVPWGATIVTFNFIQGKLREFFISFKKKVSKLKQILSKKTNRLWRERQTQMRMLQTFLGYTKKLTYLSWIHVSNSVKEIYWPDRHIQIQWNINIRTPQ